MIGGLAVRGNLLCVTWSAGRGHVFLYDLEERQRVSSWMTPVGPSGYSDAAGVAVDARFRIFVADPHNHCVRRYNAFGQHLGDLGAPPPATGDRGFDRNGVLERPHAVCVVGDQVYVAAGERERRRSVQRFRIDGSAPQHLPVEGDPERKWGAPRGIWADARGLVVADTLRGRLCCYDRRGAFRESLAVPAATPAEDDVLRGDSRARPGSVVRLSDRTCVVVEHSGVQSQLVAMGSDGRPRALGALGAFCADPLALAVDERDRIYVLDRDGERVVRGSLGGDEHAVGGSCEASGAADAVAADGVADGAKPARADDAGANEAGAGGGPEILLDLAEHDRDAPG
ncbi:MAG: hypothetical protein AB8H80_07765 [Planctomycetota bacterium]